jgi:hypothetical protein
VVEKQQAALTAVGSIEEAMVKGFPFTVPSAYDNLPQLKVINPENWHYIRLCLEPAMKSMPLRRLCACSSIIVNMHCIVMLFATHSLQGRATVEMGLTFKTARDNGIKGGVIRIVSLAPCPCCPCGVPPP